jgi:hypothetical protein
VDSCGLHRVRVWSPFFSTQGHADLPAYPILSPFLLLNPLPPRHYAASACKAFRFGSLALYNLSQCPLQSLSTIADDVLALRLRNVLSLESQPRCQDARAVEEDLVYSTGCAVDDE